MQRRTDTVTMRTLFDVEQTSVQNVSIKCSGCATTATTQARRTLTVPAGWIECGQTPTKETALWCGQCGYEGKHEAYALAHYRQWTAERDDLEAL